MKPPAIEGILLGALLDAKDPDGNSIQSAFIDGSGLVDSDFLDPRVRLCWGLIARLVARRRTVDAIGLFTAAKAVNLLRDDDLEWLSALQNSNELQGERAQQACEDHRRRARGGVIAAQLEQQARIIRERGLRPAELSGALEGISMQLTRDYAPDEAPENDVLEVIEDWDARERGEKTGGMLVVPTYIEMLDKITKGFIPGLNMILGDPSIGKSAVIASIMEAQLDNGLCVGFFGLEEGYRWMTRRLIARDLKIAVGDVGLIKKTPEQNARLAEIGSRLHALYKGKFLPYKFDGVGIDEICRRSTHWILNKGAQVIYIDHIGEIRHKVRDGDGYNWAVADSYRRLRDLGFKRGVPIVALAHRKPEARNRAGPPQPNDIGLTGEAEKMVRKLLGIWRKKDAMRVTTLKVNEGIPDITCELSRIFDAALVDRVGGRIVNLQQEKREEADRDEADKLVKGVDRSIERAKLAASKKPPKPEKAAPPAKLKLVEPPPQAALLEVPPSSKPAPRDVPPAPPAGVPP